MPFVYLGKIVLFMLTTSSAHVGFPARSLPQLENIFSVNLPEWLLAETHIYYKHTLTHRLRYCNLGRFHTGERWFQLFFASFTPTVVFLPSFSTAPGLIFLFYCRICTSFSTDVFLQLFFQPVTGANRRTSEVVRTRIFTTRKILQNSRCFLTTRFLIFRAVKAIKMTGLEIFIKLITVHFLNFFIDFCCNM